MKTTKNYFKINVLFALFLAVILFASCKEEEPLPSASNLIGTWRLTHNEGYRKKNGEFVEQWNDGLNSEDWADFEIGFKSDGMAVEYTDYGYEMEWGEWKLEGSIIKITYYIQETPYVEKTPYVEECKILKLNSSDLIYESTDVYVSESDNYEEYRKMTFKKK